MAVHLAYLCVNHLQVGEKDSTYLARCDVVEVGAHLLGCNDANATASVCIVLLENHSA